MKQCMSDRRIGFVIAAMVFLFTLTTVAQADAKQASLKTQLHKNGISMKLVRLERTDGFMFGLSFKGPHNQSIVIAPGLDRMFLVVAGGKEMILQADGTGKMQIIKADGDISYVLCIVQAIIDFLRNLTICTESDPICLMTSIITLVTDITTCSSVTTP
ncbi:MAG: hypothetical protein NTX06_11880 [Proteobacteria bacterium]|nr:hypothetical protein [Pseudomonadota bacterium]